MHSVHLAEIDLNLLPVLAVLLETRHVTRAALRLGLTQSATSHALARLRAHFRDPLLVRGAGGLIPTARAQALAAPLAETLAGMAQLVQPPGPFDASHAVRTFRLSAADYLEIELAPKLLERARREAPGIELWFRATGDGPVEALSNGELDLLIAPARPELERAGLRTRQLFEDGFVSLVRPGHPSLRRRWTPESFAALPHAFVAPRGRPGGAVDVALEALGLRRKVVFATPHFLVAPLVVANSDLVLTIPRRVAATLADQLGLVQVEPPVKLPTFTVSLFWHERVQADPGHAWLRTVLTQAVAEDRTTDPAPPRRRGRTRAARTRR